MACKLEGIAATQASVFLPVEVWQQILDWLFHDTNSARKGCFEVVLPVCQLFHELGSSILARSIVLVPRNAHRIAYKLEHNEGHVYRKHTHKLRACYTSAERPGLDIDPEYKSSLITILSHLHLERVNFTHPGLPDSLCEYLIESSGRSLRSLAIGLNTSRCLGILNVAPGFTSLRRLELEFWQYDDADGILSVDFESFLPLHIPSVEKFKFSWADSDDDIPLSLMTYLGAARFACHCEFDLEIEIDLDGWLDPTLAAALDPLFVAHRSRKVTVNFAPVSSAVIANSSHVEFESCPEGILFEVDRLPKTIVIKNCGRWTSIADSQVIQTLELISNVQDTTLQIQEIHGFASCRFEFTGNYIDDPTAIEEYAIIVTYTLLLARKGITIVDANGMTLSGRQVCDAEPQSIVRS